MPEVVLRIRTGIDLNCFRCFCFVVAVFIFPQWSNVCMLYRILRQEHFDNALSVICSLSYFAMTLQLIDHSLTLEAF